MCIRDRDRKKDHQEKISKAEAGDVSTILFLAKEAERKNLKEALYWYTKAAELDNVTGMYGIVRVSARVHQDAVVKERARFWQLRIKAAEGSIPAKYEVGMAYFHGRGTTKDTQKGIDSIQQAAKENHIQSILFLGDWCSSAQNPKKNTREALVWYKSAAQLRSNAGRIKLGQCYLKGIGTAQDHSRGVYWLERAAEKGDSNAMYLAGEAWMEKGANGGSIAYIWLFLAASFGNAPAKALRDQVGSDIGVDTIVGLQSFAKPMLKKIEDKTVSKHSIIKVLNKLYKRNVPLIDDLGSALQATNEDKGESGQADADVPFTEIASSESVKPAEKSEETSPENNPTKLDFSSSPMDKNQ